MKLLPLAGALGAAYGFLSVALGAFGAHALKTRLSAEMLVVWKTAVEYQFLHALAILLVVALAERLGQTLANTAVACFAVGVLLFSGSLYALALTGIRPLGAITPLGGIFFLVGWAVLFWALLPKTAANA